MFSSITAGAAPPSSSTPTQMSIMGLNRSSLLLFYVQAIVARALILPPLLVLAALMVEDRLPWSSRTLANALAIITKNLMREHA